MFWAKCDCVLPCMLNVMWLKTWCHSKISWLQYQRVPCLKEYCNVINLVVSSFSYLWMFFPGSWNSVEVEDDTPSQRDLVLTAQPFPKKGWHRNSHLPVALRATTSVLLVLKGLLCDVSVTGTLLTLSWRWLKHMVQVCQCLNPLPWLSVGHVCPWGGDSTKAPAASKPMDKPI